jgi:hypothetical protein
MQREARRHLVDLIGVSESATEIPHPRGKLQTEDNFYDI